MKNKRALITGGAGFIGSYVNKLLYEAGYQTLVFDNLSTGKKDSVIYGELFEGDLRDKVALFQAFETFRPSSVFHFAAKIDVGESVKHPFLYYDNNVLGSLHLLEAIQKYHVPYCIFSSSCAVYGVPNTPFVSENHKKNPINPYGRSKLIVEEMLADLAKVEDFSFVALRYFNAAGGDPEGILRTGKTKELNLIPIVLQSIRIGKNELSIFGGDYPTRDGTCIRDYIHLHDLGTAHLLALDYLIRGNPSAYFNLGNEKGYSVKEVGAAIEKVTKTPLKIKIAKRRPGDAPMIVADAALAKEKLGWSPVYGDLKKICEDAWNTYE